MKNYDIIIIGGGITGSAIARELSRYKTRILVLEKEIDLCYGTTKANSAVIHASFDPTPGTLMAKLNQRGNAMMGDISQQLDIPFKRNGAFVLTTEKSGIKGLKELQEKGRKNGAEATEILNRREILEKEKNIADNVIAGLWAPSSGIICPFTMNYAFAENAYENGVRFSFKTEVTKINRLPNGYNITTTKGNFKTKAIVNAAGLFGDFIHNQVSDDKLHIIPRKGEYFLLDKVGGKHVSATIFALPTKFGKGVLISPTIWGNLLIGPTATDIDDKTNTLCTLEGLGEIIKKASTTVKDLPFNRAITTFAGLRAHLPSHEFIIKELRDSPLFFDCIGIESPGLSAAPAVGIMVSDMVRDAMKLKYKENFNPIRKGITRLKNKTSDEQRELINKYPKYANIICSCENVREEEIIQAINRPLGAKTIEGVKNRVRPGMGDCRRGICLKKVSQILARELKTTEENIIRNGDKSRIVPKIFKNKS